MQTDTQSTKLTKRQCEIINLVALGKQNSEIADMLQPPITEGIVKQHLHKIFRKLKVDNRVEAINKYRYI